MPTYLLLLFPVAVLAAPGVEANYRAALAECERNGCAERPILLERLGRVLYRAGKFADARGFLELAVETGASSHALETLAETERELGHLDRAELLARQALAANPQARGALGGVLLAAGRYEEAARELEQALELARRRTPPDPAALAEALNNLALARHRQERLADAAKLYEQALAALKDLPSHAARAGVINNLGTARVSQGRLTDAAEMFEQALKAWETLYGPEHPNVAAALSSLGVVRQRQGKFAEAEKLLDRAWRIDRQAFPEDHERIAMGLHNRGVLLASRGRHAEAADLLRESAAIHARVLPPDHPQTGHTLDNLG